MPTVPDTATLEEAIELARRGEFEGATRRLRALLAADPSLARAWNTLGIVQMQTGQLSEAESSLLRAAGLAPDDHRAPLNLGKLYNALRRPDDAEAQLRAAVRLAPGDPDAHFSLAALLRDRGKLAESERHARRAVDLSPHDAEAHYLLARLLLDGGRFAQAEFCYRETLRLQPDLAAAYCDLGVILLETGRLAEAQASAREAIRLAPGLLRARSNYAMWGQYDPRATDDDLLGRALEAGSALQKSTASFPRSMPVAPQPSAVLKLGIVSGDLHQHPVGLFLLPLLRALGGLGVRAHLYSNGMVVDAVSRQLRELASWTDIVRDSDAEAWNRIRQDAPDVLIDLAGHTGNNRLAIFAARAAPVQISWLGYFATTGTPNMDYALMDPWHAPAGCESQFTEMLLRMPHTRFCFQPLEGAPSVAARSAEKERIVFGCFMNIAKINDEVLATWSRILGGVAGSRLIVKWHTLGEPACRDALIARLRGAGIAEDRVELRPASGHAAMLGEYGDVDIALDTFPFTGGQTSFEAAWMGVPVVTLAGHRPVSRQTLCLLGNLGLEELAAFDPEEFVARAVALAEDVARVRELRSTLRERMRASPLMQAQEFARVFVALLRDAVGRVV